jgi:hypothetical protein
MGSDNLRMLPLTRVTISLCPGNEAARDALMEATFLSGFNAETERQHTWGDLMRQARDFWGLNEYPWLTLCNQHGSEYPHKDAVSMRAGQVVRCAPGPMAGVFEDKALVIEEKMPEVPEDIDSGRIRSRPLRKRDCCLNFVFLITWMVITYTTALITPVRMAVM